MTVLLQLTTQQQAALLAIEAFLRSDSQCFVLRGHAGTGKTTLLAQLLQLLRNDQADYLLLATTGRAARILGQASGEGARTVHSLIYEFASVDMQGDSGLQVRFSLTQEAPDHTLLIVDEASMLANGALRPVGQAALFAQYGSGQPLQDLLIWSGLTSGLRTGNRILFVGDAAQLPPVGESASLALDAAGLRARFGLRVDEFELTDIVRQQQGSRILQQADQLRQQLLAQSPATTPLQWLPATHDWRYLQQDDEATRYRADHLGGRASIIITHANRRALDLNRKVRRARFGSLFAPLQVGDILMVNQNNADSQLLNGDLVKVTQVGATEVRRVMLRRRQAPLLKPVELHFRAVTVAWPTVPAGVQERDCLILENLLHSPLAGPTDDERQALVLDFRQRIRAEKLTASQISGAYQQDPYLNALQVKYGYALTCHKAQGGEWETVIVDVPDTLRGDYRERLRWLYTAITRGKRQVQILGRHNLPQSSAGEGSCV